MTLMTRVHAPYHTLRIANAAATCKCFVIVAKLSNFFSEIALFCVYYITPWMLFKGITAAAAAAKNLGHKSFSFYYSTYFIRTNEKTKPAISKVMNKNCIDSERPNP